MFKRLFILGSIVFLAGCGGMKETETSLERKPKVITTVTTGSPTYTPGDKVELLLTVTNHDVAEKRLFLKSKHQYIFEIYNYKGIKVWSSGEMGGRLEVSEFYLPALDERSFRESWSAEGNLGEYSLIGYIPVADNLKGYRDSTTFHIVD